MLILLVATGVLIVLGLIEKRTHQRCLNAIPIRIHVNGSRGKSSVTRLIAAALRAAGIKTLAKTTGSEPRVILPNGEDVLICRQGLPNIREQKAFVRGAAALKVQAIVVECMAIDPHLQKISEKDLIRSTIGVLSNVRPDHQEVLGNSVDEMAGVFAAALPVDAKWIMGEVPSSGMFESEAKAKKSEIVFSHAKNNERLKKDAGEFAYAEHPENIALALTACEVLGLDVEKSLAAMKKVEPDIGALTIYQSNSNYFFVNAFAANDVESTEKIFRWLKEKYGESHPFYLILNCRQDRPQRSLDFAKAAVKFQPRSIFLTGAGCSLAQSWLNRHFKGSVENTEGKSVQEIISILERHEGSQGVFFGVGSIAGMGLDLVRHHQKQIEYKC